MAGDWIPKGVSPEQARANAESRRREIERDLEQLKPSADVWSAFLALADHYGLRMSGAGRVSLLMVDHVIESSDARREQSKLLKEHDILSDLLGLPKLPDPIENITWPLPILQRESWVPVNAALPLKAGAYYVRFNTGEVELADLAPSGKFHLYAGNVETLVRYIVAWKVP